MITETGQIAVVSDGTVWVDCGRRSDCERCAQGRGCGGATMGRLLGDRQYRVEVSCQPDRAVVGMPVSLSVDETVIVRAAAVAYLLPLLGLLLGALTGQLFGGEGLSLVGGGAGFIVSLAWSRLLARRYFGGLRPVARPR